MFHLVLSGIGPAACASTAEAAAGPKPKSPEEWVETLVQQMVGARDMADARSRAASVLQTFQQAVLDTSHTQVSRQRPGFHWCSTPGTSLHGPVQPVASYHP